MISFRAVLLSLSMVVLIVSGCNKHSQPLTTPCEKFVLYQERKVNVEALKIAVETTKVPIHVDLGKLNVEPQMLRDAPEKIQALDLAQFAACQAVYSVPDGPDRVEASKRWATAITGLIDALTGTKAPKFSVRIDGKEDGVRASSLVLDLGYIVADVSTQYKLRLSAIEDSVRLRAEGNESGVVWKWESGSPVENVTRASSSVLILTIDEPGLGAEKTAVVKLVSEDSRTGDVAIIVKYTALASIVSVSSNEPEQLSGDGSDSSKPYDACVSAPAPGKYTVILSTIVTSLSGDRACNSWSKCDTKIDPGGGRACLVFTLQGHNEGGDRQRKSTGHISASFALTASTPSLVARAF